MIQPLRTVHRHAFTVLAVLLPGVLIAGLWARHSRPNWNPTAAEREPTLRVIAVKDGLWEKYPIRTALVEDPQSKAVSLRLQLPADLNEPDLLLYWADQEEQGPALPANARLLGAYATGKGVSLPQDAASGGRLFLYSLAHRELVDTATLEKLP